MLESIAYMLILGLLLGSLFKKMRLPGLIGMLLAGIILGPYVLNLLSPELLAISPDLREMALLIILTRAGLSLDIKDLKAMGKTAVFMSFVPACFEITATFFIAQILFGLPPIDAAILGAVIASASPAVIVPRMLNLMKEGYGTNKSIPQLILTGDSIDDVFNIVVFSSLLGLGTGNAISIFSFLQIPLSILLGIAFGVGIGMILIKWLRLKTVNTTVKVIILLSVGLLLTSLETTLENYFPFSGLISIMATGVTIYKILPDEAEKISNQLSKIWIIAEVLLFALVGATVNLNYVSLAGGKAVLLLVLVLAVRAIGITLSLTKSGLNTKEKVFCILTGIPKATVQAALGGIPLAYGIASGEMILAISVIAILFTAPIGAILLDSTYKSLLTKKLN